jgi:putative ABC transport system permease protein
MRAIGAALAREFPKTNREVGAFVAPLREHFVSGRRRILMLLLGAVGFVLLIACSNVANLLLSRTANRRKEVAVRAALGAGLGQIARQFLCEGLILAAAAASLGLLLATATFRFLAHLAPGDMTGLNDVSLDWRVLAFTLSLAALTTIAFGLIPLVDARRVDLAHSLRQSARTLAAGSGSRGVRGLLILVEVALAFIVLIGAGLLIRTFAALRGLDMGCRTSHVLTLRIPQSYKPGEFSRAVAYQTEVLRKVKAVPGVVSAGFTNHIPLVVKGDITGVHVEGRAADFRIQCRARVAGPGYMRTMGIPIRRGRDLDERDREGAPYALLINETLARTAWPDQDPIGMRLLFGRDRDRSVPVVGVVGDIRSAGLDTPPKPEFYLSSLQAGFASTSLAVHTKVEPASVASAVRQAIWSVNPEQPITQLNTMEEILDRELFGRRVQMMLLSTFAGLALLLAAIGVYGLLAYHVGRQTPEIGVRLAMGAIPRDILRHVLGYAITLTAGGVALGVAGAVITTRLLESTIHGVTPTDPVTYLAVAALLLLSAAVASYVPARRAMRVDPMVALREE